MFHRMIVLAVVLLSAGTSAAHAHHPMDYTTPATALEGLLSGLGHPVIGLDHLLFIFAAGVLAARQRSTYLLPLLFVVASNLAVAWRAGGAAWDMSELWIAGSLIALGTVMLAARDPGRGLVASVFLVSGTVHGYALAEAIVGAERTPLFAYFVGLTVIQCAITLAAWKASIWLVANRPQLRLQQLVGSTVGAAGLIFAGLAALA
jgi:urease accessory protein